MPVPSAAPTAPVYYTRVDSPLGPLLLLSDGAALTGLYMNHPPDIAPGWEERPDAPPFPEARRQLAAYFAGAADAFDTSRLPLAASGTDFQRRVWDALLAIPYGRTLSYGELARRVGDAKASRAVGLANGRNPISLIVPCHRVIGADGKLTGYGGGLLNKRRLLLWEASVAAGRPRWPEDAAEETAGTALRLEL